MPNTLSIFNGALVRDLDPSEVEALSDEDQAVLADTLTHCYAAQDIDIALAEKRKVLYQRMADLDAATDADQLANPPTTPVEAARAAIAANNPHMPPVRLTDSEGNLRRLNKKTRAALAAANNELAEARSDYVRTSAQQKILERARGEAIVRWMKTLTPVDPLTLHREAAAKWKPNPVAFVEHIHEIDRAGSAAKSRQRTPSNLKAFAGSGRPVVADIYKAK